MATIKMNPPVNRLIGNPPKVGIRPTIDGRRKGVRESLEDTTMDMARAQPDFLSKNLRHPNGLPVECVIADTCIGGVAEAARPRPKIRQRRRGRYRSPSPPAGATARRRWTWTR